jgi:hypothetical protein
MRWITPSGRIASGSPVVVENKSTSPMKRPLGAAPMRTFLERPLASFGQVRISEVRRIAATSAWGATPSIDLKE